MSLFASKSSGFNYCNCTALERQLDPAGYAGHFDDAVVFEQPLPWPRGVFMDDGPVPQRIRDLMARWLAHYKATGNYTHRPLVVVPDPEYSRDGYRLVSFYTRPTGLMTHFDKKVYQIPTELLGDLVWAFFEDQDSLPNFENYRVYQLDKVRDLMVCTHGTVDAACAKFGYPLYKMLKAKYANANTRVWRVCHFGGHVFAPTLCDMPSGHYWAYVEAQQAEQIVLHTGDVSALRRHYRGWAGVTSGLMQAAERELWQHYGWDWFNYRKHGEILAQDGADEPSWAEVRFVFEDAQQHTHTYDARVEVSHSIETPPISGSDEVYAYPQYQVVKLEKVHLQVSS